MNDYEKPGLTPEERAAAALVYLDTTPHRWEYKKTVIAAAIRAALKEQMEQGLAVLMEVQAERDAALAHLHIAGKRADRAEEAEKEALARAEEAGIRIRNLKEINASLHQTIIEQQARAERAEAALRRICEQTMLGPMQVEIERARAVLGKEEETK